MNDAGTVLVLTGDEDSTADAVIKQLAQRGTRVASIDPGDFPLKQNLTAQLLTDESSWSTRFHNDTGTVDLSVVRSVYYRRPTRFRLPDELSQADQVVAAGEARLAVGGLLASLDVLWVNHPHRAGAAEYKPLQLQTAGRSGLAVPDTIITNDADEVKAFAARIGKDVVCKEMGASLLSENGEAMMTWTTRIDPSDIDPDQFAVTAHMVQAWVPKDYEVRLTAIGRRLFAVAIQASSEAAHVDWRSDYASLSYEVVDTPMPVAEGVAEFMDYMCLSFGAFDFAVTPDGDWVFLECNPGGQWLWLEEETGTPIAAALADLLATGATT
ncbi:MAG: ATP-grasp ribosomal peptide maturase [Stackebrandtia sp.]